MTIEEVLALEDIDKKVYYLKKGRRTLAPDVKRLWEDWNPDLHEIIIDKDKYPKIKITTEPEKQVYDESTNRTLTQERKTKDVEPNRIALPIEQDIINIQTAFTVGNEPKMTCEPSDDGERKVLTVINQILKTNKIKYQNKKVVRSWLSEQECAEYWYAAEDNGFWDKLKSKIKELFGKKPEKRLRSVLWSPFRGDKLYPFFNDNGDMVAFSREYKKKDLDGNKTVCFMTITKDKVYNWELAADWLQKSVFSHGFRKLPVIYSYRPEGYCDKIHTIRVRLEKLLSEYGDCIDYHFFPILLFFCDEMPNLSGDMRNRIAQLSGEGANASYLTWQQVPDTVKYEAESLINLMYSLTSTPRISFDYLIGKGNAVSGESFKYMFMGAHMAVANHAEVIGDFMQRRINFLVSAVGSQNTYLEKASNTIDIGVDIQPYMIDNIGDKVATAVNAVSGGVWSRREGISFCGNAERMDEELRDIEDDSKKKAERTKNEDTPAGAAN